jgi:hypothetical protein
LYLGGDFGVTFFTLLGGITLSSFLFTFTKNVIWKRISFSSPESGEEGGNQKMRILDDENVLISSLSARFMVGIGDGVLTHANICQVAILSSSRCANYYTDSTKKKMAIAISPKEVNKDFPGEPLAETKKRIKEAYERTQNMYIPILQNNKHIHWGSPIAFLGESKILFDLEQEVDDDKVIHLSHIEGNKSEETHEEKPPKFQKTRYNNVSFDDKDEAQHAAFLDALQIRYKCQPINISLPFGMSYRPDFFLPELNCYLEVTKTYPAETKKYKCEQLAIHARKEDPERVVYLAFGGLHPPVRETYNESPDVSQIIKFSVEVQTLNGVPTFIPIQDFGYMWCFWDNKYVIKKVNNTQDMSWKNQNIASAYEHARSLK